MLRRWINKLADLIDAVITSPQNGEVLTYNAGQWINRSIPTPDLSSYATTSYVDTAIQNIPPTDLSSYATQDWVSGQIPDVSAFITADQLPDLSSYLQQDGAADSLTYAGDQLRTFLDNNYAPLNGSSYYITYDAISDMATQTWVGEQGFLTDVSGAYVASADYAQFAYEAGATNTDFITFFTSTTNNGYTLNGTNGDFLMSDGDGSLLTGIVPVSPFDQSLNTTDIVTFSDMKFTYTNWQIGAWDAGELTVACLDSGVKFRFQPDGNLALCDDLDTFHTFFATQAWVAANALTTQPSEVYGVNVLDLKSTGSWLRAQDVVFEGGDGGYWDVWNDDTGLAFYKNGGGGGTITFNNDGNIAANGITVNSITIGETTIDESQLQALLALLS